MSIIRKMLTKVIVKMAGAFFAFANWMEFTLAPEEYPRNVARWLYSVGRKTYPGLYCSGCGTPIEKCYDGRKEAELPRVYFCCNCGRLAP
jgi:hypothetical protein